MQETFGPITPIIRAPDDDDALIALSNSTAFGLSSGVCTNDFRRMQKFIAGSPSAPSPPRDGPISQSGSFSISVVTANLPQGIDDIGRAGDGGYVL